ncbi:MAG TPA: DUF4124 domain-containing protein [Gammaproteobacteria bacterium]
MRKWLILLFALSATTAASAPAWRWVDANGQVHFSDRPVPGAQQVELSGAQGFGTQVAQGAAPRGGATQPGDTPPPYRSIEVVSPADQEVLWNIGAQLTVQVQFQPALQPGHRYDLIYDGQPRNLTATTTRVVLPDVFRGTHTLQVVVTDSSGVVVQRSGARSFTVQQASVRN